MIVTFYVLTLFACPPNLTSCTMHEMFPAASIVLEPDVSFTTCEAIGKRALNNPRYVDFGCHPHQN
jgi:hypothetical protein